MKHNIQIFENEAFANIYTIDTEDRSILFCLLDVAKALGYSSLAKVVRNLWEGVSILDTPSQKPYNATFRQKAP